MGVPPKKFQIFFLKSFVNVSIGKVKEFQPLTLSRKAVIDIEKKCGSNCLPPPWGVGLSNSPIIMGDRDPLFPLLLEGGRAKLHLKMEDF